MGKKRLYLPGTQVIFTQDNTATHKMSIGQKDGKCRWCGVVLRKSLLSLHVPECRDKHKRIRGA